MVATVSVLTNRKGWRVNVKCEEETKWQSQNGKSERKANRGKL